MSCLSPNIRTYWEVLNFSGETPVKRNKKQADPDFQEGASRNYKYCSEQKCPENAALQLGKRDCKMPSWSVAFTGISSKISIHSILN